MIDVFDGMWNVQPFGCYEDSTPHECDAGTRRVFLYRGKAPVRDASDATDLIGVCA